MSRRSERLAAQAQYERDAEADQAERAQRERASAPVPDRERCSVMLCRRCSYWRHQDGLYRCCWCARLSPRSAAIAAERRRA